MERTWDIDLVNDGAEVDRRIAESPQLCMVISEDISPEGIYNLTDKFHTYSVKIDGKDRIVVIAGAHKLEGDLRNPEKEKQTFGREVKEQIFDDMFHVEGVPYFPFCKDLDPDVIEKMRTFFDVQYINDSPVILGYYYDIKTAVSNESRIIAQTKPIRHHEGV